MTDIGRFSMHKIKVAVYLISEEVIWGYIYLNEGQRLQDLMNDDRAFIPMLRIDTKLDYNQKYPTVVIKKQVIARLEES